MASVTGWRRGRAGPCRGLAAAVKVATEASRLRGFERIERAGIASRSLARRPAACIGRGQFLWAGLCLPAFSTGTRQAQPGFSPCTSAAGIQAAESATSHLGIGDLQLSISSLLPAIVSALSACKNVVLQAPPGAGKTTMVPLAILADANQKDTWLGSEGLVLVLQPRRIAARSAAARMAENLNETLGGRIGYRVRHESNTGKNTRVLVVTDGVLISMLRSDSSLRNVKCVVLDEVHERSLDMELSLALLRDMQLKRRPDMRLVLMSATFGEDLLDAVTNLLAPCELLRADERQHDVRVVHLPGPSLISSLDEPNFRHILQRRTVAALQHIMREGDAAEREWLQTDRRRRMHARLNAHTDNENDVAPAEIDGGHVLVFLPGESEIRMVQRALAALPPFEWPKDVIVQPLYGAMSLEQQRQVVAPAQARGGGGGGGGGGDGFARAPSSPRRVILATPIAESSLTLSGVRTVLDTGLRKVHLHDAASDVSGLRTVAISAAAAEQRAGRAGRQGPGVVYRMWSARRHRTLRAHAQLAMETADLSSLALQLAVWGATDAEAANALPWLTPPPAAALERAFSLLHTIGALEPSAGTTHSPALTEYGGHLATWPLRPRLGHMLVTAERLGRRDVGIALALLLDDGVGLLQTESTHSELKRPRPTSSNEWSAHAEDSSYGHGDAAGCSSLLARGPAQVGDGLHLSADVRLDRRADLRPQLSAALSARVAPDVSASRWREFQAQRRELHVRVQRAMSQRPVAPAFPPWRSERSGRHGGRYNLGRSAASGGICGGARDDFFRAQAGSDAYGDWDDNDDGDSVESVEKGGTAGSRPRDTAGLATSGARVPSQLRAFSAAECAGMDAGRVASILLALSYPERVGRQVGLGSLDVAFALQPMRCRASASDLPVLEAEEFVVAPRLQHGGGEGSGNSTPRILAALPLSAADAVRALSAHVRTQAAACVRTDGQLLSVQQTRVGRVLLSRCETALPPRVPTPLLRSLRAAPLSADTAQSHAGKRSRRRRRAHELLARLTFAERQRVGGGAAWKGPVSAQQLLDRLVPWEEGPLVTECDLALRLLDLTALLTSTLSSEERETLEMIAPTSLRLPSGRHAPLSYATSVFTTSSEGDCVEARHLSESDEALKLCGVPQLVCLPQELFGCIQAPRIADQPLCPSNAAEVGVAVSMRFVYLGEGVVATTADLTKFWELSYPQLRQRKLELMKKRSGSVLDVPSFWPEKPGEAPIPPAMAMAKLLERSAHLLNLSPSQ